MDGFDADVLIYASVPGHPLGRRVRALFPDASPDVSGVTAGVGSVLLLPELLSKPSRDGAEGELADLATILGQLELRAVDEATARLAVAVGAAYRLRALDAIHLATAVGAGADRFVTSNRRDFKRSIVEIDVTYPDDLDDPGP
jgi:predicted nucleic acid-binding protein